MGGKKFWFKVGGVAAALGLVVGAMGTQTNAQEFFLVKVRRAYELNPAIGKCSLCHEVKPKEEPSRKNLNIYGKAISEDPTMKPLLGKDDKYKPSEAEFKLLLAAVAKLDNEDTDKDGATNREEMALDTFPGDAKSIPDKVKLAKYRKTNPPKK